MQEGNKHPHPGRKPKNSCNPANPIKIIENWGVEKTQKGTFMAPQKYNPQITQNLKCVLLNMKFQSFIEEQLVPCVNFIDDLGADSLDTVEAIMEVEKAFNLSIPDDEAEEMRTFGDIDSYLQKNIPDYKPPYNIARDISRISASRDITGLPMPDLNPDFYHSIIGNQPLISASGDYFKLPANFSYENCTKCPEQRACANAFNQAYMRKKDRHH